jgi:hypothetical protein
MASAVESRVRRSRFRLPVVPVLLLLARHGERRESQSAHRAEVVDPTLIEWQEIPPQRTERHEVSLDVEYGTFGVLAGVPISGCDLLLWLIVEG